MSTGTILLATGLPAFVVKYAFPFFMNRIPFGLLHIIVNSDGQSSSSSSGTS
uniref:Candidate secreted effector n=1 Tax=Meloidogyne incognita TaxID=6306 RepID=A0A914NQ06_MELIC